MIECLNCHQNIDVDDQYCRHCGAVQNVAQNQQRYDAQFMLPQIHEHLMKYADKPWFFLLWKDGHADLLYSNLSNQGHKLLLLEMEKHTYEIEISYASPKTYEKKKHSLDIRVQKIEELISKLNHISSSAENIF